MKMNSLKICRKLTTMSGTNDHSYLTGSAAELGLDIHDPYYVSTCYCCDEFVCECLPDHCCDCGLCEMHCNRIALEAAASTKGGNDG